MNADKVRARAWLFFVRAFAWAVVILVSWLFICTTFARAQGLPAPPGQGWLWSGSLNFQNGAVVLYAPEGSAYESAYMYRDGNQCSGALSLALPPGIGQSVYFEAAMCADDPEYTLYLPDPQAGTWYRLVYLTPDPPGAAASGASAPATSGDIQQLGGDLGLLLQAGVGVGWFLVLVSGFVVGRSFT